MKKKVLSIVLGLSLVFAGQAFAEEDVEVVNPDSELYDTTREMEDAEYELTEDTGEKTLLQDQYADERLAETEVALENGDEETSEKLLEDYNEHVQEMDKNIEEAKAAGEDISEVETIVAEKSKKRSENLSALLEREDLPEEAKAGITKALENQEKAMQKLAEAKEKAAEARQKGQEKAEEAQQKAEEARQKGEEKAEEGKEKGNKAQEDAEQRKNENANKGQKNRGKQDESVDQDESTNQDQETTDSTTQQESPEQEQDSQQEVEQPTTEEGQGNAPAGKPSGNQGGRP